MNAPNKLKEKTIIESNRVQILKDFDFEATLVNEQMLLLQAKALMQHSQQDPRTNNLPNQAHNMPTMSLNICRW